MKIITLTFLLILSELPGYGQGRDTWTAFWNKDTTLIGFKDKGGVIKIEPKFQSGFTLATKFDDIIAAADEVEHGFHPYYLTKEGRIVGRDSIHIFDNGADCESEGFIRFGDRKTDKVGMFNRKGKIVIPAEYNDLSRVRNGLVIALKGASKHVWEGGEHYSWTGGKVLLVDTLNNTVIDDYTSSGNLNFYSLLISPQPSTNTIRQNFKAVNGLFYSFIDFDKEFKTWLRSSLLNNFTKENLLNASFKEITFWKEPEGWISEPKSSFIDRNYELIRSKLLQLKSKDCDYEIFDEGLNPFIYTSSEYDRFFNNCRESKDWMYPIKNVVISYKAHKNLKQDQIGFLRTESGYKLLSFSMEE